MSNSPKRNPRACAAKRLTNLERLNLIIDFIKTNNQPEGYTIREIKDKEGNEKYIVRKNKKHIRHWYTQTL